MFDWTNPESWVFGSEVFLHFALLFEDGGTEVTSEGLLLTVDQQVAVEVSSVSRLKHKQNQK